MTTFDKLREQGRTQRKIFRRGQWVARCPHQRKEGEEGYLLRVRLAPEAADHTREDWVDGLVCVPCHEACGGDVASVITQVVRLPADLWIDVVSVGESPAN